MNMTREEKTLLIQDLCSRLPYGVKIRIEYPFYEEKDMHPEDFDGLDLRRGVIANTSVRIEEIKPYLRPISSMTEDEENEWSGLNIDPLLEAATEPHTKIEDLILRAKSQYEPIDWLNAHHFDYRGLIEKGLALEAPEGMYND